MVCQHIFKCKMDFHTFIVENLDTVNKDFYHILRQVHHIASFSHRIHHSLQIIRILLHRLENLIFLGMQPLDLLHPFIFLCSVDISLPDEFFLVRDLIVDRSFLFENLKKLNLWLESEAYMIEFTHEPRYQSARCLMCGCCLEVCPNFSSKGTFAGAVAAVNAFRIPNEEQEISHQNEVSTQYKENYFEGCGKSLACHNICPIGLPVEELIVRSNSVAIWGRQ